LTPTQIEFVLGAVGQPSSGDNFAGLNELQSRFETTKSGPEGQRELREIAALVSDYGDRIRIDPTVVRGLEYYTGPVYEVELL
ncbi:hypothetical protein ABTN05_20585, partial [Acinetobacter baumannii]